MFDNADLMVKKMNIAKLLKSFWSEEEGITMVEYAVAAGVVVAIGVALFQGIGAGASKRLSTVNQLLT